MAAVAFGSSARFGVRPRKKRAFSGRVWKARYRRGLVPGGARRPRGTREGFENSRAANSANRYSVILCVRYLQRSVFPQICRALRPGGMLLFETYTKAQLDLSGGPRDPAHLLNPGELRRAFPGLETVFYRELRAEQGIASLAARKPQGYSHRQ